MSRIISVIIKKENTMEDNSAAMGILRLTANSWSSNTWESFTGTESGFGKFSEGEWKAQLNSAGPGNTRHYLIFNEDKEVFLVLMEAPAPGVISEGNVGKGELRIYGGGTLTVGAIEWKVLGTY